LCVKSFSVIYGEFFTMSRRVKVLERLRLILPFHFMEADHVSFYVFLMFVTPVDNYASQCLCS